MHDLKTFSEFCNFNEGFTNLLKNKHDDKRAAVAQEIYDLFVKAYSRIGGLKQNGMESAEAMVEKIPFWKIARKNGKIVAVVLYKDKGGRKTIAIGTDFSKAGKDELAKILQDEVAQSRSYSEISGAALNFRVKRLPPAVDITTIVIPFGQVKKLVPDAIRPPEDDPEIKAHPTLKDYFFQRKIKGEYHTKIMMGNIGNTIK